MELPSLIIGLLISGFVATFTYYLFWSNLTSIPFVPSNPTPLINILQKLNLPATCRFLDIGSGDGRIVRHIAKVFGWKSVGIDINPYLILLSKLIPHPPYTHFYLQSVFNTNLSQYNILFIYGFPEFNSKLSLQIISQCRPGTVVVSRSFALPGLKLLNAEDGLYVYRYE